MEKNNYFYISYKKEIEDISILANKIIDSGWVNSDITIINCSPDYSSYLTQIVNHRISFLNNNELFEVIDLPMPYPTMSQVWDTLDREYRHFDKYLAGWITKYIEKKDKYLFIDSGTLRGKNFHKVKTAIRNILDSSQYRFASLYLKSDSIFTPDFYTEKFDSDKGLVFAWENLNNPNWDY